MITVRKRNELAQISWEYTAEIIERGSNFVRLEAFFNRADLSFQGITLKNGDRFIETYFLDRWYNIFEIHDRDDDTLKGWYCNIGRPMVWDGPDSISYMDMLLDLWVNPDGSQEILDEAEFQQAGIDEVSRLAALQALAELQNLFKERKSLDETPLPGPLANS